MSDAPRQQRERELEEQLRRKDEFLATLSHELRNPLAPIASALEILGRYSLHPDAVTCSRGIIQRQLRQITRLVDDLLEFSRTGRGMADLTRVRVDVTEVIAAAVETARPTIELRGHRLATRVPPAPYLVDGDLARLSQVLTNLLINAAKYTPPGGDISVLVEGSETSVPIRVRDSGAGIASEKLENIFQLFVQDNATSGARMGGLGIGLAVARHLVELHGGTISAESEGPGRGSEFTVSLPRAQPPRMGPWSDVERATAGE